MNLTNEQIEAVQSLRSCVTVTAGPGCGKTATIAARVKWLIDQGADPRRIAVVSFTRQAASELRERLDGSVWTGTLHSLMLKWVELNAGYGLYVTGKTFQTPNEQQRRFCALAGEDSVQVASLRSAFAIGGSVDYLEILVKGYELVMQGVNHLDHLIVDEVQDLDELQWAIVDKIGETADLFLVGDPSQSVYSFRGARVEMWDHRFKSHKLTRCFRCPYDVIATANVFARKSGTTTAPLFSAVSGGMVFETSPSSAVKAALRDFFLEQQIAVLCRYNATADKIAEKLRRNGLRVCREVKEEVTPISALMQFLHCPQSYDAFSDLKKMWEGIECQRVNEITEASHAVATVLAQRWVSESGAATPGRILQLLGSFVPEVCEEAIEWSDKFRGMSLGEAVQSSLGAGVLPKGDGIPVWTIHRAKGREWPAVIVIDDFERTTEEEYRLAYVQITRTMERCYIVPGIMYSEFVNALNN